MRVMHWEGRILRAAVVAAVGLGANPLFGQLRPIPKEEVEYQTQAYQHWWGVAWERRLEELPRKGSVPAYRIPYSGHDYPDRGGGTVRVLRKYDLAFHGGRSLASSWEHKDTGQNRQRVMWGGGRRRGLFRRIFARRSFGPSVPGWHGHCNGWTAAAIRHPEPQWNVERNGVVFTPADIKGLLAEIYMYNDSEFLGGIDPVIHPAVLHLSIANWIGRGSHPIGMETEVGPVVVNYPAYAYEADITPRDDGTVEVVLLVTYAVHTSYEMDKAPRHHRRMRFHYLLSLDDEGRIDGGTYFYDSAQIDMLWAPLQPVQAGEKGNERGNPHVDVKEVLAIWRESVPKSLRMKWWNIDPTPEDRIPDEEEGGEATSSDAASPSGPPVEASASEGSDTADAPAAP